jgi:ATP-dependent Clp protease adaptor protein ClpS
MGREAPDSGTSTTDKKKAKTKRPSSFKVTLLNDDFTSMDFVVAILETVFQKTPAEATQIMLQVHMRGSGMCGVYSKQVAEAKVELVHARAQEAGYPLRCIMEEV